MKSLKDNVYFGFLGSLQLLIAFIVFISLVWRLKRTRYITIHINIKTTLTNIELPQKCDRKILLLGAVSFLLSSIFHEMACRLST